METCKVKYHCRMILRLLIFILCIASAAAAQQFVTAKNGRLYLNGKPYYFTGTNYWYGGLLANEKDPKRGIGRLRKELDLLKANGVTNLRLLGGAEGSGMMNGVLRVGPAYQKDQRVFDEDALNGLDIILAEMAKRKMHAVIFLSNNWEWSGGFQQYLIWNGAISKDWLTQKPDWDTLRDLIAKFYTCPMCKYAYAIQVARIVRRINSVNGKPYRDDPTIMAWEIANEPRPMRPAANDAYKKFIAETADQLKTLSPNHLVTIGHEGWIGTESIELFEQVHADKNVDYLTIHIWPKNWGWFENGKMAEGFPKAVEQTVKYINDNAAVAVKLGKPLVIEEFGLPRDGQSFDPGSTTKLRDEYYKKIFSFVRTRPYIVGTNFWAFGGTARPIKGQLFWKPGDEYMGDPPMEEQGLNSVFTTDASTWAVIRRALK